MYLQQNYKVAAGFTIIELTAVVVIVSVMSAAAVPLFSSKSAYDERFFYDDLLQALRFSQHLAIASGCSVQVSFSITGYSLLQDTNCNLSSPEFSLITLRPGVDEAYSNESLPSAISFSSSVSPLIFNSQGQALNDSGVVINQATVNIGERSILIEGETGFSR